MVAPQAIFITLPPPSGGDSTITMDIPVTFDNNSISSRKRRLVNLSMEEKLYRKKLKNRVAAQTSRDRKKARMDELECTVSMMTQEIDSLTRLNDTLESENALLKQQLQDAQATTSALLETLQSEKCSCGKSSNSNNSIAAANTPSSLSRPAESLRHPLLKGLDGKQADNRIILRTLLMGFLLSQNFSPNWDLMKISQTLATWSDLQKASLKKPLPVKKISQIKNQWWGRHQKSWNPVDQMLPA